MAVNDEENAALKAEQDRQIAEHGGREMILLSYLEERQEDDDDDEEEEKVKVSACLRLHTLASSDDGGGECGFSTISPID